MQKMTEYLKKPYLTEKEVAELTGRALSSLRNDRFLQQGWPYLKIGKRSIRYKLQDVIEAMEKVRISFE